MSAQGSGLKAQDSKLARSAGFAAGLVADATAHAAALVGVEATPNPVGLVGSQRVLQAGIGDRAVGADGLGLEGGFLGLINREEDLYIDPSTGSVLAPAFLRFPKQLFISERCQRMPLSPARAVTPDTMSVFPDLAVSV